MTNKKTFWGFVAFLMLGLAVGYFLEDAVYDNDKPTIIMKQKESPSQFVNPTVVSGMDKHFIINFRPLKTQIQTIQNKYSQKTYIYFDYLNNASWVGSNERDLFAAASTDKVPLAMAIMKAVEDKKIKLSDTYSLDDLDINYNFGELYKSGANKVFTIDELMIIMLEQSDNTASTALFNILKKIGIQDPLRDIFGAMGWEFASEIGTTPTYQDINAKTLSNMFISLYNATYIDLDNSNYILEHLTRTPFSDKIVAGIPVDILASHKIGIANDKNTFSDCGIVYAPNRNYILCLGISGTDEKNANQFMTEISTATYDYVINN